MKYINIPRRMIPPAMPNMPEMKDVRSIAVAIAATLERLIIGGSSAKLLLLFSP
jgi:hypothetical protein